MYVYRTNDTIYIQYSGLYSRTSPYLYHIISYQICYMVSHIPYRMDHKLWILIVSREYAILVYWVNKMSWYIRSLLKYRLLTNETIDLEWFFTFLNRRLWTYSFHFNFHFREKAIPNRKKMNFTIFVGDRQFTNDNNLPLDEVCLGLIQFESIWYELLFSCKSFIKMWPSPTYPKKSIYMDHMTYNISVLKRFSPIQRHQKP